MKKIDKYKQILLQKKREKKRLKKIRKNNKFSGINSVALKIDYHNRKVDEKIIAKYRYNLDEFFKNYDHPESKIQERITVPGDFRLEKNFEESMRTLSTIRKSILFYKSKPIAIDFSKCDKVDFSSLFLLRILLDEIIYNLNKLNNRLNYLSVKPNIKIIHSKSKNGLVNLKLLANNIVPNTQSNENRFIPVASMNLIKGKKRQKHYAENKKGLAVTNIRNFINNFCLKRHNVELNKTGINNLDGLLTEILNNAEDHSRFDEWYVFGNLFEAQNTKQNEEVIGEINLAIVNFGYSIYEGFENTKEKNMDIYNELDSKYNEIINTKNGRKFTKENLFTLYALQEGVSRLKYKEHSRGTGTVKFIKSFLELGDYEDNKNGFHPRLLIFSGQTVLKCDNKYKPYKNREKTFISLNREKSLDIPPEHSHLKHQKISFPGTLLVAKIYLSKNHLKQKINNEN